MDKETKKIQERNAKEMVKTPLTEEVRYEQ